MKKILVLLFGLAFCADIFAGTLIYKTKAGEEKRVSGLTIVSIDGKKMVVRIKGGTETISMSQVIKYFDTDLSVGGEMDDNTGDYTVHLGSEKLVRDKKSGRITFSIPYSINRASGVKLGTRLRQPYFYLFVLAVDEDSGQRKMMSFSYPAKAKVAMKNYDEAKMMEKAIDLDRPSFYDDDFGGLRRSATNKSLGGRRTASFSLNNVRNGSVIAWYLVVWGKDKIVETKEWRDSGRRISTNWWIR